MRAERPHPAELAVPEPRPILSAAGRAELFGALFAIVAGLYLLPACRAWIEAHTPRVQTSVLVDCAPPAEFEQLHLVVANRGGRLVAMPCLYVGSTGTYR